MIHNSFLATRMDVYVDFETENLIDLASYLLLSGYESSREKLGKRPPTKSELVTSLIDAPFVIHFPLYRL